MVSRSSGTRASASLVSDSRKPMWVRAEGLRAHLDTLRRGRSAVCRPIGMPKGEPGRWRAFDQQPPFVICDVMRRAERDEIVELMPAAVRTKLEVMHVDERRVPAPWNAAAPAVATQHLSPSRRRNRLLRALG